MATLKVQADEDALELQRRLHPTAETPEGLAEITPSQQLKEYYPSGLRFVLLTTGLILTIFLSALDTSIISTAIPKITDHFGTVKDVGWYGSAYTITNAAFQSTWGKAVSQGTSWKIFVRC